MFEFTTQSVYNKIVVSKNGAEQKDANVIVGGNTEKPEIRIGNTRFSADNIEKVYIKAPTKEYLAKVIFDISEITDKVTEIGEDVTGRIVLYVGLSMNSQDSFYANDFVYKGKPLFIEFGAKKNETVTTVAKRIKAIAKKYLLLTAQEKILNIEVTDENGNKAADGTYITIEGVNGYQQLKKAILQWFNPEADTVDCCTYAGDYEDLLIGIPAIYKINTDAPSNEGDAEIGDLVLVKTNNKPTYVSEDGTKEKIEAPYIPIYPGIEAFGDYNWMIHNLRLPTLANTNFWAVTKGEMPIPGQSYTQIIVKMVTPNRDGIAGEAVGQRVTSVTTHVFYVAGDYNDDNSEAKKLYDELSTFNSSAISSKIIPVDTNTPFGE